MNKKHQKVKVLNQEYFNQQTAQNETQREQVALNRKHRLKMLILCIIMLVLTLVMGFNIIQNNIRMSVLKHKTADAKVELKDVKSENKELKQKVDQLKDSDYVAKYIRQKYYFSKKGETIYSLPGDKAKSVTDN